MSDVVLHVRGLTVRAGRRVLLSVDELAIQRGEVVALLGPNGAGKTTLLRACLGFQRAAADRLTLLDQSVLGLGWIGRTRLRRRVGYVPQQLAAHGQMPLTVREVAAIGRAGRAGLGRRLNADDWRQVDDALELLGLTALADRSYAKLSGGEQRKTAIARALVQDPEILMLDEPAAYLDLRWREQIVATMQRLYEQRGVTTVLVCHELEVLPPCCRRVVLLDRGAVQADGTPEEVLTTECVRGLFGGGLTVRHENGRHAVTPTGRAG